MRGRTICFRAFVFAAAAAGLTGAEAFAQQASLDRELVLRSEHPSVPDAVARQVSPFELQGLADIAFGGIRSRGNHIQLLHNDGTVNYTQGFPAGIFITGTPRGGFRSPYFVADFVMGAARGDWVKAQQNIPSLANALGEGYNAAWNVNAFFFAPFLQWQPGDDQLGRVHGGASSTDDGSCTEHNLLDAGVILMNINDCRETWGSEQFAGATRKTTLPQWEEYFAQGDPNSFSWDWWDVPPEFVSEDLMGDAQSYYEFRDYAADRMLNSFGNVVPTTACTGCGVGDPTEAGWPMGISIETNVFSFSLPAVVDAAIYQMLIINNSEAVYGTGIDFDSLYVGNMHGYLFQGQDAAHYWRPELGALLAHNNGFVSGCNGATTSGIGGCEFPRGTTNGGTAIMFLKSPLGDLRNKAFSNPESPFFNPAHPAAGDTITFNHGHRCSFGACFGPVWRRSERSEFGLISSQPAQVLDGRTETAFDAQAGWWDVFSNVDFPTRTPEFTTYLPPEGWDYDKDGVQDTLHLNSCHTNGCVELLSDTLPGKQNNEGGNFQGMTSAGPFALAAGDTVGLTLAFVSGRTPPEMVQNVRNVLAFYQNAFLGPQAPPAPAVVAVNTQVGDRDPGDASPPPARVTIFIDDAVEEFVDPFLSNLLGTVEGSQLDIDNPGFVDSLRARIVDNVQQILVFKSCDLGQSFTADNTCQGDPLEDETGTPIEGGWQPYQIMDQGSDGTFPNVFTDEEVTPGVTHLYSFVSVSKGFEPLVLERDALNNLIPVEYADGAPELRNPLSASTSDPSVVAVYVPASRQTGAQDATVEFTQEDEFFTSDVHGPAPLPGHTPPGDLTVQVAGDVETGGEFSAVFGDSVEVRVERSDLGTSSTVTVSKLVLTSLDAGATTEFVVAGQQTFVTANPAGVSVAGGTTIVTTEQQVVGGDTIDVEVTTTTYARANRAPIMVLIGPNGEPEYATSSLTGSNGTPGSYFGRPDFPLFLLDVNAGAEGNFIADNWIQPNADTIGVLQATGEPELDWIQGSASSNGIELGEYLFTFSDAAYGPDRVFIPNLSDPGSTVAQVAASLSARNNSSSTAVSAEIAAALAVDEADLLSVSLPFTVTNATTGAQAIVAMTTKLDTISVGRLTEEIRVAVPSDQWVPGDRMTFLERRMLPQTALSQGGTEYVVVDGNNSPVLVDSLVQTFPAAILGCNNRLACNPVPADADGADIGGHLPLRTNQQLRVRYASGVDADTRFSFEIRPAVRGDQITDVTQEDLDLIRVVPNPYVFFSEYEQGRDSEVSRLMFANLPPDGQISIFTVSGQLIQRISYDSSDLAGNGDLFWDMRTLENTDIAAGLYLFLVEGTLTANNRSVKKLGKFVVIR